MAAENLTAAAEEAGVRVRVETHGSIGVEGTFTDAELREATAVVVAADTAVDTARFAGIPLVSTRVDDGVRRPAALLRRALDAGRAGAAGSGAGAAGGTVGDTAAGSTAGAAGSTAGAAGNTAAGGAGSTAGAAGSTAAAAGAGRAGVLGGAGRTMGRDLGRELYAALMNGVSHMIPFVVTGGLLIAVALSLGGDPTAEGLVVPDCSPWKPVEQLGALAFTLMVPVISGYIAQAIADRPGLAPGFITGLVAATGALYHSEAGAGFLGGIVTGLLSGYVARWIRRVPVHRYIAPVWPIIVIPVVTTVSVGLVFIYVLGRPIAAVFTALTEWLAGMDGDSVLIVGAVVGAMIAFDMGGPFNKTAFLFGGGLIAAGNAAPMGMAAAAIAVPPLGMGLASVVRRRWFTRPEQEAGIAALFMGFFGITEGAIPFAVARPLQVIPANVLGGAVAGALAGATGVRDNVMHGGPIVAVLGAVDGVPWFAVAVVVGALVTASTSLLLMGVARRRGERAQGERAQGPDAATGSGERVQGERVQGERVQGPDAATGPGERVQGERVQGADAATGRADASDAGTADAGAADTGAAGTGAAGTGAAGPDAGQPEGRESLLTEGGVVLYDGDDPAPGTRDELIRALAGRAAQVGRVTDVEDVVRAAVAREETSSTAAGHGVAIPHARTAGVAQPVVTVARVPAGAVEWDTPDGAPVRLVFLIAVPDDAGSAHLRILASLARALMREPFRRRLLDAPDAAAVAAAVDDALAGARR
ncbi:fructose-specific PTS transporter subunit EIIC [Corynebacterium bovis]|nr:fructose-specific PTS transporter subunit EIIC [Corynebacterium bovis]MDH2456438.1 fructose-specific PTS transporter subunit EIIC [Corynebacterium bovis]